MLQTVDIAIVRGELVPVGEDQVAHLELSREIVRRFNRLYGDVLVEPQADPVGDPTDPGLRRAEDVEVARQLHRRPGRRAETIRAKVRSFVTDPQKNGSATPAAPRSARSSRCISTFSPDDVERIDRTCRSGELGCVEDKTFLADRLVEMFRPFRQRRAELEAQPGLVEKVLAEGVERVRPVARATLDAVREAMHFA